MGVYYLTGSSPETGWNSLIQEVNDLSQECPDLETLELVSDPHRWAKSDIREVQDLLREICEDNEFSEVPDLWRMSTIQELIDALNAGECCDDECDPDSGTFGDGGIDTTGCIGSVGTYTDEGPSCQVPVFNKFGFPIGISDSYQQTFIDVDYQCLLDKKWPDFRVFPEPENFTGSYVSMWELGVKFCRTTQTKQIIDECDSSLDSFETQRVLATGGVFESGLLDLAGVPSGQQKIIFPRTNDISFYASIRPLE